MENQPSISSDLIRGHIDTIILHTLTKGDKYAQQISDSIEEKSGNAYKINQATLYSSLKRLESLKLVSAYWNDCDGGRRKFFKITDEGAKTVEDNLSSWAYSRSIIDKLMNLLPVPVVPQIIEKQTVVYTEKPETSVETAKIHFDSSEIEKSYEDPVSENPASVQTVKPVQVEEDAADDAVKPNEEREINFRNIINGLVEIANQSAHDKQQENKAEEIEPIVSVKEAPASPEVLKFNETINETDYNANKVNFNDKIDYGDLTLKAAKEGYNIRISSKDSAKPVGHLLINKLNFAVSAIVLLIAIIEIGLLYAFNNDAFSSGALKIVSLIPTLPFVIFGVAYLFKRKMFASRNLSKDAILTAAIAAFNFILINLALDFIFDLDFSNKALLLYALVLPVLYYLDMVLFFVIRYKISKKKAFSYK
ncbi:MAG: helix-turn-helix transcriptional regulator [Clostridia bacterium]|nr:helix-turn-helix transcriptional regulator [Clostridia bacterium]